jgi:signal transduction histidine kinase
MQFDRVFRERIAEQVHDLRTPLVAVRGYTRMVLEERAGPLNGTQREYMTIVAENTAKVIALLSDLQRLAANEPLHFERFDARDLWPQAMSLIAPRFSETQAGIAERITSEPLWIVGDRSKLAEALAEILSSAIRCSEAGGALTIEMYPGRDETAELRVVSTSGELPAKMRDAFNRCSQQDPSSSGIYKDLGMGLSIACDYVRLHGGRSVASADAARGFTFTIQLPARSRNETA